MATSEQYKRSLIRMVTDCFGSSWGGSAVPLKLTRYYRRLTQPRSHLEKRDSVLDVLSVTLVNQTSDSFSKSDSPYLSVAPLEVDGKEPLGGGGGLEVSGFMDDVQAKYMALWGSIEGDLIELAQVERDVQQKTQEAMHRVTLERQALDLEKSRLTEV